MAARKSGCLLRNVPLPGGGRRSANAADLPANVGWAVAQDGTIIYRDTESGRKAAEAGHLGLCFLANGIPHEPPLPSGTLINVEQGFYRLYFAWISPARSEFDCCCDAAAEEAEEAEEEEAEAEDADRDDEFDGDDSGEGSIMPKVQVATMADRNGSSSTSSEWCITDDAAGPHRQPTTNTSCRHEEKEGDGKPPHPLPQMSPNSLDLFRSTHVHT